MSLCTVEHGQWIVCIREHQGTRMIDRSSVRIRVGSKWKVDAVERDRLLLDSDMLPGITVSIPTSALENFQPL